MIGERRKNSFCNRLLLIICLASSVISQDPDTSKFYPFGPGTIDTIFPNGINDNDIAERIDLERAFPFGERYHSTLFISENGVLAFDEAVFVEPTTTYQRSIPFSYDTDNDGSDREQPSSIFPFWSDTYILGNENGYVYYRVTDDINILDRASTDVRGYFRSNVNFRAQVVIIATWDRVSFYAQQGSSDPRNTFQTVLITDGQESFVFFIYAEIQWIRGTTLGGNADTGLSGTEYQIGDALIGFYMRGEHMYRPTYFQEDLRDLPTVSNVDNGGFFAYKVDGSTVMSPACSSVGAELSITPSRCSMMGGEYIYLYGPCWSVDEVQTCVFTYNGQIIQEVNATIVDTNEAYCVPDPFFLVGEVTLTVQTEGELLEASPSATYSLIERERVAPTVTRENSDTDIWETTGNQLTITWTEDPDSFGSSDSALTISVLAYREDSPGPRWEEVYTITNSTADDGSYTFTPMAQPDVTEENAFGIIRITGNANTRQRVLWSDIHPLGYLLEESYQESPAQWASEKCNEWITADNAKVEFLQNLPACPCTLSQAEQDVGTFITDPTCYPDGGADTCAMNEGAVHCLLSAYASPVTNSGTKCCYDADGLLIHSGDTKYAGMPARSHVRGASPYRQENLVPELSHWSNDVIAWYFCCEWANDQECYDYVTIRPTTDCVAYEPPNIALSFGDPHFITLDRANFTFNGLGEYTLLRYATSGAKSGPYDFELQGRQVQSRNGEGENIQVTQLSAVAMQDSDSDSIFVEASASSGMDIYRKSVGSDSWLSIYFSQQTFIDLQGCAVGVTQFVRDVEVHGVVVMFKSSGIGVHVTYDYGMLAVRPILPATLSSNHLSGLLGNMDGDPYNDLEARNSDTPLIEPTEEDIFQLGQTWEIETDYSLFYYMSNTNHEDYHNASFVPRMNVPLPTLYPECQGVEQCLFDYEVSNDDANLAMATLGAYEAFQESEMNIEKIDACMFLNTPFNGTKSYTSNSNKYFEGAEAHFTCDSGTTMLGSAFRRCAYTTDPDTADMTLGWTGAGGQIECFVSICGVLDSPQNGSITLDEGGTTATFECDEGFTLSGASTSICQDGLWTNGPPSCLDGTQNNNDDGNAVVIALSVVFSLIFIVLIIIGIVMFMRYYQYGSFNTEKEGPQVKTKEAEINWGMEDDGDLDQINATEVPAKTPQPKNETPYL